MARRSAEEDEIHEAAAVAYDHGYRSDVGSTAATDSPFYYGFRWHHVRDAAGRDVLEEIPLTPDDYLHPQEGDLMTQGNPHERMVSALADVLRRWLEKFPGFGVFSDVLFRWGVDDLPSQAPDVAVVRGLADPAAEIEGSFDCAALGIEPCLAIELVSTTHEEYRPKDLQDKVRIYERAGVAEYLIVDPTDCAKGEPFKLIGYRLDAAGGYDEIGADERGALSSETTGLRLVPNGERGVVVEVDATGERLLYSDEVEEALRAAERRAAQAEQELARLRAASGDSLHGQRPA